MRREVIGITLAVSIGLSASVAWAAPKAASPRPAIQTQSAALRQGIQNYNRGFILKALPYFEQATRQNPKDAQAFLWMARAYQKQGKPADFAKAKVAYQNVLQMSPDNVEALSNLGEMWSWDPAMRAESIQLLRHAQALKPSDAAISRKLAEALFWSGNADEALRYAEPIASLYRSDRKWMGEYAQMLSSAGRASEALAIYNTDLKDETARNSSLKLDLARTLYKSGQRQQAQALFADIQQSLDSNSAKNPDLAMAMAGLAFDLELYNDSLKWDQSLPDAMLRQKDVQLRQGRALMKVFRTPEAIETFYRLYDAGLLSANEKVEYAEYLRQLNLEPSALPSPDLVETLYREAAQEAPNSGEVALRLARQYAQEENRFDETLKAYQLALSSGSPTDRAVARQEFLDYLKNDKAHGEVVEGLFQQMLSENAGDIPVKAAYAEYLSWQSARRPEALRMYVELGKAAPEERTTWEARLDEVLKWQQPSTALIPVYQEVVNLYPQNRSIWLAVARAYRNDPDYYKEAVETYGTLVKSYRDDATIKKEWLGLLLSNERQRDENIRMLKQMIEEDASDLDVVATYGKLLSYQHQYGPAMKAFEDVLFKNPEHREALVGKGYVILWSGRKLEAKAFFKELRQKYPDDVDIAIGLAQSDKLIGRYDEALRVIQEIKPLMDAQQQLQHQGRLEPESSDSTVANEYHWVDNVQTNDPFKRQASTYDFSLLPYADDAIGEHHGIVSKPVQSSKPSFLADIEPVRADSTRAASATDFSAMTPELTAPSTLAPIGTSNNPQVQAIRSEIDALSDAVNTLKLLQASSAAQLETLDHTIRKTKDAVPYEMSLQATDETSAMAANSGFSGSAMTGGQSTASRSVGAGGMVPAYGTYAALDYDTNPLLSGMGRFRNDELSDLEKGLLSDLRPMIRGGFLMSRQDGEATTSRISSLGFPNQVSLSLTPQIRVRGGIQPTHWYLPRGVSPKSSWGVQYGAGATVKYWDRLTLDGDIAITNFTQSNSTNLTFQAQAQYDINDSIRAKIGMRRIPQYNSLLTVTGLRPNQGAFRGDLLGQARENGIYAELNTHPFTPNWDWNLGYEWAFIDGSHIPRNTKNQAFTSLGYTWHYATNHQARLGYEFLYFGYGKNATNGFFDTTSAGIDNPVVSLRPVALANSGYVFGGYYSPSFFLMNAARLDLRGNLFHKFLEYKVGGSLGAQTVRLGHHIRETGNGTALATSFDANLIMNFTDWLAAYGDVDFLNAGGQFNRWRFGGGLIVRPHIDALSPIFGQAPSPRSQSGQASPTSPPEG